VAEKRGRVLILGLPFFGERLAGELRDLGWEAEFAAHPGRSARGWARIAWKLARADVLYLLGARAEKGSPLDRLLQSGHRRPVVVHWVGTDVLIAAEEHRHGRLSERVAAKAVHWTDTPWLVDELAAIGMRASLVPLPVASLPNDAPPLPAEFRVLLYLPEDSFDREVFEMDAILALPGAMPETRFVLFPSRAETLPALPANVETPGWVGNMDALYQSASVLVRLVNHDGMPFSVLEALARGRQVVYPYSLPGVTVAKTFEEARAALRTMESAHEEGSLSPNQTGMAWVREEYRYRAMLEGLDARLRARL
jgi:hypothetical protein